MSQKVLLTSERVESDPKNNHITFLTKAKKKSLKHSLEKSSSDISEFSFSLIIALAHRVKVAFLWQTIFLFKIFKFEYIFYLLNKRRVIYDHTSRNTKAPARPNVWMALFKQFLSSTDCTNQRILNIYILKVGHKWRSTYFDNACCRNPYKHSPSLCDVIYWRPLNRKHICWKFTNFKELRMMIYFRAKPSSESIKSWSVVAHS